MFATAATIYIIIFKILSSLKLLIGIFFFLLHFFNRAYNIMKYEEHCWLCRYRSLHHYIQLIFNSLFWSIFFINSRQNVYYDKKNVINVYMYEEWCLFFLYMYKTTIQKGCVVLFFMTNNIITTRIIYLTTMLYTYCCFWG